MRLLIFIIIFSLIFSAKASNFYEDKVAGIANNDLILKSDLDKHTKSLLFILNMSIDYSSKYYSLDDLIKIKLQAAMARDNKIASNKANILKIYRKFIEKSKTPAKKYSNLTKKFGLTLNDLKIYIDDTVIVEALHDKLFSSKLFVSKDDIYNYTRLSNNQDDYNTNVYTILKFKFEKDKIELKNLRKIMKEIKNNNEIRFQEYILNKNLNVKIKIKKVDLNLKDKKISNILRANINARVIGPVYENSNVYIIKILKKNNKITDSEINLKVNHCFIKKNIKKNTQFFLNKKNEAIKKLKKIQTRLIKNKTIKNDKCKDTWLNNSNTNKYIYDNIKDLEKNNVSQILEDQDGWHVMKIHEKNIDSNSVMSKEIKLCIQNNQLNKFRKNLLRSLKNTSYIAKVE